VSTKLTGGQGLFGSSVAVSADGRAVLVGAPSAGDDEFGEASVFRTSGGGAWVGAKLKPYGADGDPGFGYSVALSGNGTTAIVGGPFDNRSALRRPYTRKFGKGAAWLFKRSGLSWRQFGNKLTGAVGKDGGFGAAVDLDFDGTHAIVGAPKDREWAGAAFIFDLKAFDIHKGTPRSARIATDRKGDGFGWAVSIDGPYAAVGGALQAFAGSIRIYEHKSSAGCSWCLVYSKLQGHGHAHFRRCGRPHVSARRGAGPARRRLQQQFRGRRRLAVRARIPKPRRAQMGRSAGAGDGRAPGDEALFR
jgi:hypothetical protein